MKKTEPPLICNRCNKQITEDRDPKDGWELKHGEIVCHTCCVKDTRLIIDKQIRRTQP